MNVHNKRLFGFGMLLALVGSAPVAFSEVVDNSGFSDTAWAAEGNVRCSDYFSNNQVLEMGTSGVLAEGETGFPSETLSGADNPLDADTDPETVTYTVTDTSAGEPTELSFTSTTDINAVIIKQGRTVNFYSMPTGGRSGDFDLDLDNGVPDDGIDLEISAVSFCYGIPGDIEIADLPACTLGGEGNCEEGEAFECNVIGGQLECCSCGGAPLEGCQLEVPGDCPRFTSLTPSLTGTGSNVICVQGKKGMVCYYY